MIRNNDSSAIFADDRRVSNFTAYAPLHDAAVSRQAVNFQPEKYERHERSNSTPEPIYLATQLPTYALGRVPCVYQYHEYHEYTSEYLRCTAEHTRARDAIPPTECLRTAL